MNRPGTTLRCVAVAVTSCILMMAAPSLAATPPKVTLLSHVGRYRLPETILVTPNGRPAGGKWQRWINAAKVPTYRGVQILDTDHADVRTACIDATACTAPAGPCPYSACGNGHPETWLLPDDTRDSFYYEHGHIIDFTIATDRERTVFMRLWRIPGTVADWWKDEAAFATSTVFPAGELWSAAYQLCAIGDGRLSSIDAAQGRTLGKWAISAQRQSCMLFRHL